ncbi:MAG: type II toxin-antitoxin system RelE/ParE family toxin [Mycobacteriales bacterium]|nr:type II toxin-antitoxin system RelE/ParE family toxin [Frankia sp.]
MRDEERYRLVLTPRARRLLTDRLLPEAAFAAWELVSEALTTRPKMVGVPLDAPFSGQWGARRGEYRVRYEIDDVRGAVRVLDIAHRRDAYRS